MKSLFALAPLLLLTPILRAPAADIVFGVEKGKQVTKNFEIGVELELSEMSGVVGGQEIPKEAFGEMEITMSMKEVLEIVDEYGALQDGKPSKVVRKYEKAQREERQHTTVPGAEEGSDDNTDKTSELEGKQVVFTLKDGEYTAAHVAEGGDASLLEKLKEDMDLRDLLPGKEITPGDTWKVPTLKVLEALSPGGSNGFKKDEDDEDELFENMKGESEATFKEVREDGGHKYAVIVLAIAGESSGPKEFDGEKGTMGLEVELEGEVLWDLAAKRFHSFDVQGDVTMLMEFTQEIDGGGQKMELEMKIEMTGKLHSKGSAHE